MILFYTIYLFSSIQNAFSSESSSKRCDKSFIEFRSNTPNPLLKRLGEFGFSGEALHKLAALPKIAQKIFQLESEGKYDPRLRDLPRVLNLYRGIHLKGIKDFNANFGLDSGVPNRNIFFGLHRSTGESYAKNGPGSNQYKLTDKPFLITYQIPRTMLHAGGMMETFYLGVDDIKLFEDAHLGLFQFGIEELRYE